MKVTQKHFVLLLVILLVALAVRLAYWQRTAVLGPYRLSMDTEEYYRTGVLFSQGDWLSDAAPQRYTRAPGYPLLLATILATFGPHVEIILLFQVFVSVSTVALVYACGRRTLGARAGLVSAGLMALAPAYSSIAATNVMSETLFAFLILLFLYLFWRWGQEGMTWKRALASGLILGYATLTRSQALAFLPLAALWLVAQMYPRWRLALGRSALVLFGVLLLVLPYTARNYIAYHRFILVDTTGGFTLWNDHPAPGDDLSVLDTIDNPAIRQDYAIARAIHNILADPWQQLGVHGLVNLSYLWHLQLDSYARGAGVLMELVVDPPDLRLALLDDIFFVVFTLLALAGLAQSGRRFPSLLLLWVLYSLFVVFGTHAEARFRLQFYFVPIMLAGAALAALPGLGRNWTGITRFATTAAALAFLACAYSPRIVPLLTSEYYLAFDGSDPAGVSAAIAAFPAYVTAYDRLGDLYRSKGQFDLALAAYADALKLNPFEVQAQLGRLDIFKQQGASARPQFKAEFANLDYDLPAAVWTDFIPAPNRRVDLADNWSSKAYALNFDGLERSGKRGFRWTHDHSFVKFTGLARFTPTQLVLYAHSFQSPAQPDQLPPRVTVLINHQPVGQIKVGYDWGEYSLALENPPFRDSTWTVELRSPTFWPYLVIPGSTDKRELGIAVSWIELRQEDSELHRR